MDANDLLDVIGYKRCLKGHLFPSNGLFDGVCGRCEAEMSYEEFDDPPADDHADDEARAAHGE